jgi:outer membrane receptor protein involved in Fe transport
MAEGIPTFIPASPTHPHRAATFLCVLLALATAAIAQNAQTTSVTGQVVDQSGALIPGAIIRTPDGKPLGTTDTTGHAVITCAAPCSVRIDAPGFAPLTVDWRSASPIVLQVGNYSGPAVTVITQSELPVSRPALDDQIQPSQTPTPPQPAAIQPVHETVSITAYRTPLGDLESPASTRLLTTQDLQQAAPITLDGQLRLIPGVETFRRSSSLVANPSSQGLSLRGLGSTSASRTLVTQDDIPLNDAFAGWIHWEELPELSIRSVEAVRGGASDLYGSSAVGGVINVMPLLPTQNALQLKSSFAGENTYQDDLLLETHRGRWGALATGGILGTDGFILTTPASRGLIDVPSNVHAQNGLVLLDRQQGPLRLFTRLSALNEARGNGTPIQLNGTRIWRYSTGADWNGNGTGFHSGTLVFRLYGSTEHFRQTFSSIGAGRNSEVLNRFAKTPDNELGAVLHWSQPVLTHLLGPGLLLLAGADTHDIRANDQEHTITAKGPGRVNQSDRQRQTGAYLELLFTRQAWTISASGRLDWFSNFDGISWSTGSPVPLPAFAEHVFDPRLGISRKLGAHYALSATGFRAYRAPTANELYRSTQVGSLLTLPNNNLRSERATGWETGIASQQHWGTLRASYFWTRVNRPITALTTNPNSNPILLMRENLGQIESRGISLDTEFQPTKWMTLQGGYQYTNATVTQNSAQPQLVGNWIPQVAHNSGTAQLRAYRPAVGVLSLQARLSGRQFDDDLNTYLLHSYFKLDAYASHNFGKRIELFTSAENLFDRTIEVGRTPTLTLGTPRIARIGFNLKLSPTPN